MSTVRARISLAILACTVLLLTIDATVLHLAIPSLTEELAPSSVQILWIGDIYSLILSALLVTMGNLADRIGRKKLLLIGATAFGFASAMAAFSTTPNTLILARLLLGIAGATFMPSTLSLIRTIFTDPAERTRAVAIWSAAASGGVALGPLLGGFLLEHFWWGSVFLINIPVVLVILIVGYQVLPESKNPNGGKIDLISSFLSVMAIVPFVYVIKKIANGTFSPYECAIIAVGAIGLILFVRRQKKADEPMIDIALFHNSAFSGAVFVNFVSVFALSGVFYFFSQYLQLARNLTPLQAGLAQLPTATASLAAAAVVGIALRTLGRGKAIAAAMTVGALGLCAMAAVERDGQLVWVILALIPLGLGSGLSGTLSVDAVVSSVRSAKAGAAASISETAYELGVALGIAVCGSTMTVLYRSHLILPDGIDTATAERIADSLASANTILEKGSSLLNTAQEAFVHAMQQTNLIAAAVMIAAALIAFRYIPSGENNPNDKEKTNTEGLH